MNFIKAANLVQQGKIVHRTSHANGIQMSLDKNNTGIVLYHVASCELYLTIDDIIADDWIEGTNY